MKRRTGFTLIQALVLFTVVVLLAAVLFPVFARRSGSRRPSGQSNLRQIGLAVHQYAGDNDDKFQLMNNSNRPFTAQDNWAGVLLPYLKSSNVFQCSSDPNVLIEKFFKREEIDPARSSYALNKLLDGAELQSVAFPGGTVMIFEVNADKDNWTQTGKSPSDVTAARRHLDGSNICFVDVHVKWLKPEQLLEKRQDENSYAFVP